MNDLEIGRYFHDQLAAMVPEDQHPDDDQHDEQVGRALRTAMEGEPALATERYNAWAVDAGYEPVRYLGTVDGVMRADIVTAVIEMGPDYVVRVVEGDQCR